MTVPLHASPLARAESVAAAWHEHAEWIASWCADAGPGGRIHHSIECTMALHRSALYSLIWLLSREEER